MQKFRMDTAYPVHIPMTTDAVKLQPATEGEHKQDECLPYRSLVGCLQYLVSGSRPELATAIRILSKFLDKYSAVHWRAAKRVLRYLIGSQDMGLHYDLVEARKNEKLHIEVYTDANFASEGGDMKSVSGFTVYCNGQLISAKSWKQDILAESTCEAELIAANTGAHDAVWLEQFVDELQLPRVGTVLYCDSSSARELMKHAGYRPRRTGSRLGATTDPQELRTQDGTSP
ncbi:hypothetical protein ON010_g19122 [Phytophthora cinnamomi]|nr:hypothetical protein ON010_g19122 [Phytophthora cinnamomi]